MQAPGLEGAYVGGKKYRTAIKGTVVYDSLTPYRENHLMLDVCRKVAVKRNYAVTVKLPPRTEGRAGNFDTDQRKPWFIKAQRVLIARLLFLVMMY